MHPLASDTLLQNRYRLIQVLGQGGFARTYLAEDQGRFQEQCVLKEFIPSQSQTVMLEKSRALFQQEAEILYRIQHPQIPQFRASFEYDDPEGARLFLVQDYVEGPTYRELLNDRKTKGQTFSEAEVRTLLQQLLPVLAHIHAKGIIHRDISLENLILRQADQRPVLIDFGVVKTVVTQLYEEHAPGTVVGKLGFAPFEQIQTGRAYPNSDLYALGVCALVLLTGREPQVLFDDDTATWQWRSYAQVTPAFAQVLERMVAYRPGDRYPSVRAVVAALAELPDPISQPASLDRAPSDPAIAAEPQLSQMRTIAADRLDRLQMPRQQPAVIPSIQRRRSLWETTWLPIVLGFLLAIAAVVAGWSLTRLWIQAQRPPVPSQPPVEPEPIPAPSPPSISVNRTLNLAPGEQVVVEGELAPGEIHTYRLQALEGQELSALVSGQGVRMRLLDSRRRPLRRGSDVTSWRGRLLNRGEYLIQVQLATSITSPQPFRLTVDLTDPQAQAEPIPLPLPAPELPEPEPPEPEIETIQLPESGGSQRISGQIFANQIKRYLVPIAPGQAFTVAVEEGSVTLNILDGQGNAVASGQRVLQWSAPTPAESPDSYTVDVVAIDNTPYALTLSRPTVGLPPEPEPEAAQP